MMSEIEHVGLPLVGCQTARDKRQGTSPRPTFQVSGIEHRAAPCGLPDSTAQVAGDKPLPYMGAMI